MAFFQTSWSRFSRQDHGKLSFYDTMRLIIGMGKGSTSDEIMDFFDLDPAIIPSQSAFSQCRSLISMSAFQYLFSEFSSSFPDTTNQFKDRCILAFDGCHVVYATNSDIIEGFPVVFSKSMSISRVMCGRYTCLHQYCRRLFQCLFPKQL